MARAGKVRGQTPKVEAGEKKKKKTGTTSVSGAGLITKFEILRETKNDPNFYCTFLIGRAKRRIQYNRRFVNVVQTFGRKRGPNANS